MQGTVITACALAMLVGAQGSASAAVVTLPLYNGFDEKFGYGQWNDDPTGSLPGDSIRACDIRSDGKYIRVGIDTDHDGYADRFASTEGHKAPYCSPWKGGNLKEGKQYVVHVWANEGSWGSGYVSYWVNT